MRDGYKKMSLNTILEGGCQTRRDMISILNSAFSKSGRRKRTLQFTTRRIL